MTSTTSSKAKNETLKIFHSLRLWANFYDFSWIILFFEYKSIFVIRILNFCYGRLLKKVLIASTTPWWFELYYDRYFDLYFE